MKYWEIIADKLSKAGWSFGWVSAVDSEGRTIWIVDAHRDTISAGNSRTESPFWLSKRLAEGGITIRKNGSILDLSSNPTKKVSSK